MTEFFNHLVLQVSGKYKRGCSHTLVQWFVTCIMQQKKPVISRKCGQLNGCDIHVHLINIIIPISEVKPDYIISFTLSIYHHLIGLVLLYQFNAQPSIISFFHFSLYVCIALE